MSYFFLARDAMHSAEYSFARRLPVTRRYSIETAKYIHKLYSPSGSHMILAFPYQMMFTLCFCLLQQSANQHTLENNNWAVYHWQPCSSVAGPRAWNNLPVDLRLSRTFTTFKTHLKSHLFNISFPSVWLYKNTEPLKPLVLHTPI